MQEVNIEKALTYIEPGPLVLVTTFDGLRNNVMTISWTMAIDFAQHIVLTTGPWNHSFNTLMEQRECVVCIPPVSMLETVVRIGMVSGTDVDKFEEFGAEGSPGPDGKGAAGGRLHRLPGVSGDGLHRPLRIYHPESDKSRGESRLHRPEDDPCLRRRDLYGRWRILQLP